MFVFLTEPEFEGVPLEKLFLRSVETLPDGEFKTELLGNLARYRKLLTHKKSALSLLGAIQVLRNDYFPKIGHYIHTFVTPTNITLSTFVTLK